MADVRQVVSARDVQDIQRRLQAFAAGLPDQAWLTGRGWAPDMFPDHAAHRRYLDDAFPGRPVQITDRDGHQVLVNSRALALAVARFQHGANNRRREDVEVGDIMSPWNQVTVLDWRYLEAARGQDAG